jgi:hypothetical protein
LDDKLHASNDLHCSDENGVVHVLAQGHFCRFCRHV